MNVQRNQQDFPQRQIHRVKQISFDQGNRQSQLQTNLQQNIDKSIKMFIQQLQMNNEQADLIDEVIIDEQFGQMNAFMQFQCDKKSKNDIYSKIEEEQDKQITSLSGITRGLSLIHSNSENQNDLKISSFFAWFLLVAHAFGNAVVPCWMTVQINGDGLPKTIWRNLITGIFLIPFLMYEQRNITQQKCLLKNLLNKQNLKKYWQCSLKDSIWVLFGSYAIKFTSRAHSFCLLRLRFLLLTVNKLKKNEKYHEAQVGGLFLASIGIIMLLSDSYFLPQKYTQNAPYTSFSIISRFSGDSLAIIGSLVILYFDRHYKMPQDPQFTSLFIYKHCLTLNLMIFSYFFAGCSLSFDKPNGLLRLFEAQVFVDVFYVSIMLGLNLLIGTIMVQKIFSQFIRNVASCFEIIIMTTIYHLFSIQVLTSGLTYLGFSFFVPGMMLIIGGQNILQNRQVKVTLNLLKKIQSRIQLCTLKSLKQIQQQQLQPSEYDNLRKSLHRSHQVISFDQSNHKQKYYKGNQKQKRQ